MEPVVTPEPVEADPVVIVSEDIDLNLEGQAPKEVPGDALEAARKELQEKERQKISKMNEYIYEAVGGKDKFKLMADTLRVNLDPKALELVNAKLSSGNKTLINEALTQAVAEYKKIKGFGGKRMEGDATIQTEKELRLTKEEYRTLMRTEKYKTDPIYRNKIDNARLKTREEDTAKYGPGTYYGYNQGGRYEL